MSEGLSHYGYLNAIHVDLLNKRQGATCKYERERLGILIANCVGRKQYPTDVALREQMKANAIDHDRFLAERADWRSAPLTNPQPNDDRRPPGHRS